MAPDKGSSKPSEDPALRVERESREEHRKRLEREGQEPESAGKHDDRKKGGSSRLERESD